MCSSKDDGHGAICTAFVLGLREGLFLQAALDVKQLRFCAPDRVTVGQMRDIFVKNLRDHPEHRHEEASSIFYASMIAAYPCSKAK